MEILVNNGQHYDYNMVGVFFEELHISKPNYDLGIGSGSHGNQTGEMLKRYLSPTVEKVERTKYQVVFI